jgi:hypothetical protein
MEKSRHAVCVLVFLNYSIHFGGIWLGKSCYESRCVPVICMEFETAIFRNSLS